MFETIILGILYRVHKLGCNNYIGCRTPIYKEHPVVINKMNTLLKK